MTDTVAINDRIGELCCQFRLPTMQDDCKVFSNPLG